MWVAWLGRDAWDAWDAWGGYEAGYPILWLWMGIGMMMSLQGHKLAYLLPISRKDFAMEKVWKMIWMALAIAVSASFCFWYEGMEGKELCMAAVWKAGPASLGFAAYQVAAAPEMRRDGKGKTGTQVYHLSQWMVVLNVGVAMLNIMIMPRAWGLGSFVLPVLNYVASIAAICSFYRAIAYTDEYYDEW